jgi:hypothetical protein
MASSADVNFLLATALFEVFEISHLLDQRGGLYMFAGGEECVPGRGRRMAGQARGRPPGHACWIGQRRKCGLFCQET